MKRFFNVKLIAVICLAAYFSVSLISAQFSLMTKRQQLNILNEQAQRIELETEDIRRVLEIEEEEDYIERIARQKLGYANPDEKIYKDIQGE